MTVELKKRKIYVASSWRNVHQQNVVSKLRYDEHEVYNFRNPAPGESGFSWSQIDEHWEKWTLVRYLRALCHPIAEHGFQNDWSAMQWADTCILVLPSGRSAHIEAGYFVGAEKKQLFVYMPEYDVPDLMYKMADGIFTDLNDLRQELYL